MELEMEKKTGATKYDLSFLAPRLCLGNPQALQRSFVERTNTQSSVIHDPFYPKNDNMQESTVEAWITQPFVATLLLCLSFLLPTYARMSQTHPRGPYSGLSSLAQFGGFY